MKKMILSGLVVLMSFSGLAEASLMGDSVTIQRNYNDLYVRTTTTTVVPGIEIYSWNGWMFNFSDYDIVMNSISNTGYTQSDFNGFVIGDLNFGAANEVISSLDVTGIDSSRVFFSEDSIRLDFGGLGFANTQSINVGINTTSAVPLPNALLLMSTGLMALFGFRRNQK